MFFTKYPHPANFSFVRDYDEASGRALAGSREFELRVRSYENGHFRMFADDPHVWRTGLTLSGLEAPSPAAAGRVEIGKPFDLTLLDDDGRPVVATVPGQGFGVSGQASLFQFEVPPDSLYFGMGEKWFGRLELSGVRTKFWNTDVWSDFHWGQWSEHAADPPYFSTPYLAVRTSAGWTGFLLDDPGVTFMETPGKDATRVFVEWQRTSNKLILGSENGRPDLWILHDKTLAGLTRKLQALVGKTPLPPLWSLGYHQSRWGYGGHDDLMMLDQRFEKEEIPCSGLWLDLDYMDGFRIFETSKKQFPKGAQATADSLAKNGRRIVPIIDPGVKKEPGNRVYDEGREHDVFCKNVEGGEFVGLVWPGETVYPDFNLSSVRSWWSGHVAEFRRSGFGAAWIDMNDPSTGPVDPNGLLFHGGVVPHGVLRNQYALGMQMATRDGFLQAFPDERPFLLSRSGSTGSSRYSAIWTGDNVSNEHYLRQCVPTVLGMSLSGLPFCGPDVGGFGGDAGPELMSRWIQACFLFPFFRNHSTNDSRYEEPWRYPAKTKAVIARFIRLRYTFLPYLYQLFADHEETGEPIVRPLIYAYDEPDLASADGQFLIGPELLQAPVLSLGAKSVDAVLPGETPWFDLATGDWFQPGRHKLKTKKSESPLFARQGALVPVQERVSLDGSVDLSSPTFLVALHPDVDGTFRTVYVADDGVSFSYQKGERSAIEVGVTSKKGKVRVDWRQVQDGFGPIRPKFWFLGGRPDVTVNGAKVQGRTLEFAFTGRPIDVWEV
ncbi:MAG: hypothetical protein JST30_13395 [Armatimonadetes bacterium]|nr:hypothetical protein [Armatimonadota bacterium]